MFVVVREESHEKTNPTLSTMIFFFPRYTRHEYSLLKVLDEQLDDGSLARINDAHPGFFPDVESVNQRSCYETSGLGDICKRLKYILICSQTLHTTTLISIDTLKQRNSLQKIPQTFKSTPRKQPTLKGNYAKISIGLPSRAEAHPCVSCFYVTLGACWNGGAIGVTCPHLLRSLVAEE